MAGFAAKKLGSELHLRALSLTPIGSGSVVYARLVTRAGAIQLPAPGIPPGTALLLISLISAGLILTVVSATASNGPQAIDLLSSVQRAWCLLPDGSSTTFWAGIATTIAGRWPGGCPSWKASRICSGRSRWWAQAAAGPEPASRDDHRVQLSLRLLLWFCSPET